MLMKAIQQIHVTNNYIIGPDIQEFQKKITKNCFFSISKNA